MEAVEPCQIGDRELIERIFALGPHGPGHLWGQRMEFIPMPVGLVARLTLHTTLA